MLYLFFNLKLLLAYYLSICLCNKSCIAIKKLRITLRNCRDRETVVKENKVTSKKKKQKKEIETKNKQTKKHSKKFLRDLTSLVRHHTDLLLFSLYIINYIPNSLIYYQPLAFVILKIIRPAHRLSSWPDFIRGCQKSEYKALCNDTYGFLLDRIGSV